MCITSSCSLETLLVLTSQQILCVVWKTSAGVCSTMTLTRKKETAGHGTAVSLKVGLVWVSVVLYFTSMMLTNESGGFIDPTNSATN